MLSTDARASEPGREILVWLAQRRGVKLRPSYARVRKFALIQHPRSHHTSRPNYAGRCQHRQTSPRSPGYTPPQSEQNRDPASTGDVSRSSQLPHLAIDGDNGHMAIVGQ